MYYNDEQADYEAAMNERARAEYEQQQAEYEEQEAFNQYLDSLIHQERFTLLSIEIVLKMIRNEYSDKSGKTIVEFLDEERKKYEQLNQTNL